MPELPRLDAANPDEYRRIREVFDAALERSLRDRDAFLTAVCGGDAALRREVERMLAADEQTHALVHRETARAAMPSRPTACLSCRSPLVDEHRFCPSCGSPVAGDGQEGRFRAGALFASRFRIVSALGRGGMGEVYRAHDLELGQPVALKFLSALRNDDGARARLRNEVRLARQLAHPNVCRVYDIGEAHGELYLSMEYVDGEDLASLLKRIGRLPVDKGIEIARKLCAGLAAAHAKGVLHRDFKPANIMIDAAGEVRIMDFGLAAMATELEVHDIRSGTPAYMAPEQLAGKEATVQSDLYALGLVLYELFTGKAPFGAKDLGDLQRQRESHPSTAPATLVPEVGPRIERVILRCLEPDPGQRPPSALDISASLPGGDPLAEALAAGETPSPELVAASGPTESPSLRASTWLLVTIPIALASILYLSQQVETVAWLPEDSSPNVLSVRARDLVQRLGYDDRAGDEVFGFSDDNAYVDFVNERIGRSSVDRLQLWHDALARGPSPLLFWYRRSDEPLIVRDDARPVRVVTLQDPPQAAAGMVAVLLDVNGRLRQFKAVPRADMLVGNESSPEWPVLFAAAGLDSKRFTDTRPESIGEGISDARHAWTGTGDGLSMTGAVAVHVEAAAFRGKVTEFTVMFPWSRSKTRLDAFLAPTNVISSLLSLAFMIAYGVVARLNMRAGRADTRAAWRVALFMGSAIIVGWALGTRHVSLEASLEELVLHCARLVLLAAVLSAASYLAIEPWIRRYWPHSLVTWSRLVAGRWRDPMVARDVLIGIAFGLVSTLLRRSGQLVSVWLGDPPSTPSWIFSPMGLGIEKLKGGAVMWADMTFVPLQGFVTAVQLIFLLLVFRVVIRKPWLSVCLAVIAWIGFQTPSIAVSGGVFWFLLLVAPLQIAVGVKYGLVASIAFVTFAMFTDGAILTFRLSAWYGESSMVGLLVVVAAALWAYRLSLGGQPALARWRDHL